MQSKLHDKRGKFAGESVGKLSRKNTKEAGTLGEFCWRLRNPREPFEEIP